MGISWLGISWLGISRLSLNWLGSMWGESVVRTGVRSTWVLAVVAECVASWARSVVRSSWSWLAIRTSDWCLVCSSDWGLVCSSDWGLVGSSVVRSSVVGSSVVRSSGWLAIGSSVVRSSGWLAVGSSVVGRVVRALSEIGVRKLGEDSFLTLVSWCLVWSGHRLAVRSGIVGSLTI